jgi:hypothetical protein
MAQATPTAGTAQKPQPVEQMTQKTDDTARPQMGSDLPPPRPVQQGAIFTDWASI